MNLSMDLELQSYYKKLYEKVVGPVLGLGTLMLCVTNYRYDMNFFTAIAIIVPLFAFAQITALKNWKIKTPFMTIETKTDYFDSFRWFVLFSFDILICLKLGASHGQITLIWTLLLFGALVETTRKQFRYPTIAYGYLSYLVLVYLSAQSQRVVNYSELVFYFACMAGTTAFFLATESWLINTLQSFFVTRGDLERLESEAENIKKNAFIGSQLQIYLHEVNNALMLIDLSGRQIEKSDPKSAQRLKRALNRIGSVKNLVLDQLSDKNLKEERQISTVKEFIDDLNETLIKVLSMNSHASIQINTAGLKDQDFKNMFGQRPGALYYILANLTKNSAEAIHSIGRENGFIEIKMYCSEESFHIEVHDNGGGLNEKQIEDIRNKKLKTSKKNGHGWGTIFVINECEKSQIGLEINSTPGEGTTFCLTLPLVDSEQILKEAI